MPRGNTRKNSLEQYYTQDHVAEMCVDFLLEHVSASYWIEPSAGAGMFKHVMEDFGESVDAYDIEPASHDIKKADWLTVKIDNPETVVFGNPPFGRACSMAVKHFNHAAKQQNCKAIAFIIPPSFKKISIEDKLHLNFWRTQTLTLPRDAFEKPDGTPYEEGMMQCEFQIWERKEKQREKRQKYRSSLFSFVTQDKDHDVVIRTHGSKAGTLLEPTGDWNFRTCAFIKIHDGKALKTLKALEKNGYDYYKYSTAYIPCIAPAEIAVCVDEYLLK